MTTLRRLATLPLLLAALLALLALSGVLLWSTPAEAQTVSTLVSNLSQGNDDSVSTDGNEHAQLFHTGNATNGYILTSVIVDSEDIQGDAFDVEICEADSNGFPTSTCTDLDPPESFAAGNLEFTYDTHVHNGLYLSGNTNYVVVIKQDSSGSVTLDSTTSGGEDSGSLSNWTIKDKFDFKSGTTWQHKSVSNEAIRITVKGFETPGNTAATGRPRVLASAVGAGILFADTEAIGDANGLPFGGGISTGNWVTLTWSYQWVRVDGNTKTNVGADSASYQPVEADVGNMIEVKVSFTDGYNYSETVTSLPFGPINELAGTTRPVTTLVSNTGQTPSSTASITERYAQGFRLGDHGQGYEISSVSIDLAAAPSNLTVSLWSGAVEGGFQANTATKLFEFANPSSFAVGLNEFTAPAGAFAYPNVNYFVVLSGFGASLSINETTSDNEDAGGETDAVIYNDAAVRALTDTGPWGISADRASVLRLAVKGSQRVRGILASSYTTGGGDQEIVSVGDKIGFGVILGAADRYLIRGVSFNSDDTTSDLGGWTNPFDLNSGSRTGPTQFSLTNTRGAPGLPVWTAPQGATVAGATGGQEYVFSWPVTSSGLTTRRFAVLTRFAGAPAAGVDDPAAAGVSFTSAKGDVDLPHPSMAVLGEPLDAMVQNLGQTDNSHVSADSTNKVVSQGFTTGSNNAVYRLQGIGVNIEGSGNDYPDGPTSVSVSVHSADSAGKPDAKLFDLVSPDEFAVGHSFFEAPPGTTLDGSTSYVLVWTYVSGTAHRLQKTSFNTEDPGAAPGSSIADVYYLGANLGSLSEDFFGNSVEIAVYTKEAAEAPEDPSFDPGLTGGGPGHFGGGAIIRCFVSPPEKCPTYGNVPAEQVLLATTMTVGKTTTTPSLVFNHLGFTSGSGYIPTAAGSLGKTSFKYSSIDYTIESVRTTTSLASDVVVLRTEPTFTTTFDPNLTLELDGETFLLREASLQSGSLLWKNPGITLTENSSVDVKLSILPMPNAYGYRTIWNALMTAGDLPQSPTNGYNRQPANNAGELTNDLMVDGRDETVTIGTPGQPRYPWTGYRVVGLIAGSSSIIIGFASDFYPNEDEVAGWTLVLDGQEFPFVEATQASSLPSVWTFLDTPGAFTVGQQVSVAIRTKELQNRIVRVNFKSRRSTSVDSNGNIVYGNTHFIYDRSNGGKFGPGNTWELQRLNVTTDKTGDTDPVSISATFRAPDAGTGYQGWWEGQFDDFHTLFLRWIYNEGGIGKGEATYTFPLKAAAEEGGIRIRRSTSGRDISFTWVRTYKEFKDKHLDLANHRSMSAHMLAPPQPATARAGGEEGDGDNLQRQYVPTTVTSVEFTSNSGSDQVYGVGDTIQVTVTFSEDVTVSYDGSKKDAAEVDLEMGGETRTAHYARTDGNKVILEYTVVPGDEETFGLLVRPNSLRLDERVTETQIETKNWKRYSWIRDSEGRDAVLDHNGLADTGHRVDAVGPDFASAQVSTDGTQVAVTFDESIRSPAILRAFGVQTSLLQSLTLDVRVDGELAPRSDAAVSGDTVTLTMPEPITQGQTVTVSYDNLFIERGESIFEDLRANKLLAFTEQPATNGSTVADVDRPNGGLALSRTDLEIDEGESAAYTVALASQPASDVTVAVGQRPPGRATVTPASLTFTADNWNTPQTVTITSAEDANYVGRWVLLRHVATGDDYGASAVAWLLLRDNYNLKTATPNTRATGRPTISGTPQVDQTLTLDTSEIADADGLTHASYTYLYQWIRNNSEIAGQTDSTYTLVDADESKTIKVKVSFTDDANNAESRTSAATVAVAPRPNNSPTGAPTISGTPQVGETLTADTSAIDDADGLTNVAYRYQWVGSQPVTDEDTGTSLVLTVEMPEQTDSTYTLVPADEGLTWKVKVSFTDDAGNAESLTSAATVAVAPPPNYEPTGLPAITGTPQVGQTLTADTSAIEDADGLTNVAYQYQWLRNQSVLDANTGTYYYINVDLPGETGSTYTLAPADKGRTFAVRVSFTDDRGNSESLTSRSTVVVAAKPNSEPTGLPAIDGTPQVGQTLTADTSAIDDADGLTNVSYEYRWTASKTVVDENTGTSFPVFPVLSGDTNSTYTLAPADQGYTFQVRVSFTDDADNQESLTSVATVAVAPKPNSEPTGLPAISGTPQVGQTLTADTSPIDDADGLTNVSYRYQWTAGGSDIGGATGSSYTLTASEQGQTIQVRVTFTDDADNEETLTSEATVAVAAAAPASLTAAFQDLPDSHDGSTAFTFRVLFSEDVGISYVNMRDDAFTVDEGGVTGARRVDGRNDLWEITVEPDGDDGVAVTLTGNRACTTAGAICTREDSPRQLTNSPAATIPGPPEEPPTNTSAAGAPTISGTPQVEQTLTADTSSITDEDGLTNVSFEYQWLAGGSDIAGATGSTYTLTSSEQGQTVQVRVTFTDDADNEETLTSAATVAVAAAPNRGATGQPVIGGTPQVEETLTADTSPIDDEDGLTNVSYSYQWIAGGSDIDGATGSTHTLTASQQGKTIQVRVAFTDDRNNAETLTSIATAAVAAAPEPLTVRLKAAAPASHDGSAEFTFEIEFSEEFGISYATLKSHAFNVTGGTVEKAQRTDKPSNIPWRITVKPQGTGDVTIELPATTDCGAAGAICTGDGRKLSNSLNLTVSGPGQ